MARDLPEPGINVSPDNIDERQEALILRKIHERSGLAEEKARDIAAAVLCVLEQRLSGGEGIKLANELPSPLRAMVQRCEKHPNDNPERFGAREFIDRVSQHLEGSVSDVERVVRAVLVSIREQLSPREVAAVDSQLPVELRSLWHESTDEESPSVH